MALQSLKELHLNKKKIIAWNNKIKTTNQEKDEFHDQQIIAILL